MKVACSKHGSSDSEAELETCQHRCGTLEFFFFFCGFLALMWDFGLLLAAFSQAFPGSAQCRWPAPQWVVRDGLERVLSLERRVVGLHCPEELLSVS